MDAVDGRQRPTQGRFGAFCSRYALVILLAGALALRCVFILWIPASHAPDEIMQSLEQAHRVAFGYGIVPWEFYAGTRSYLPIYVLAGILKAAAVFTSDPATMMAAARLFLAAVSLLPVAAVWHYASQFGRGHAIVAGVFAASWYEIVFFSSRPLTEAVAFDFLLTGLCLALAGRRTVLRDLAIGFCLALAAMLRFHLVPAILYAAFVANGSAVTRRTAHLVAGAALPIAAFAVTDVLTWGTPFAFIINALHDNVGRDVASAFGTAPAYFYLQLLVHHWAGAVAVLGALIAVGWKKYRPFVVTALIILVSHSFIPHKEYRFVFAAYSLLALVAALASADVAAWLAPSKPTKRMSAMLAGGWLLTSASLAVGPDYRSYWTDLAGALTAQTMIARHGDVCGLAVERTDIAFSGGYAYLHRPVPIVFSRARPIAGSVMGAAPLFNYVVFPADRRGEIASPFHILACQGGFCVAARPGPCTPMTTLPADVGVVLPVRTAPREPVILPVGADFIARYAP